jgi:fructose-1,6-bisphosphatase/inositol monophosphatase family enzyme
MVSDERLLDVLRQTVIPGGTILHHLRGKMTNEPKESDLPSELADQTSTAHTSADDLVQEVALAILYEQYPETRVNAEENTSRVKLFDGIDSDLCYHLDPLDGTYSYVQGKDGFSIGAAFSRNEEFIVSAIYFPAKNRVYLARRNSGITVTDSFGTPLEFDRKTPSANSYIQKRAENLLPLVDKMHLEPHNTMGAHHGMIAIAEGDARVLLYHRASPHDFGIPQVIVEEAGGVCTDLEGNGIEYTNNFARLPWFLAFYDAHARDDFFKMMSRVS